MERIFRPTFSGLVAILALFMLNTPVRAAFTELYCSSQNTGSTDAFFWTYQSNSKCIEHCNSQGTYAFAVIKWTDCWCSNYIPRQQQNLDRCAGDCPGFPTENCGSQSDDLYIYLKLSGQPSGTAGGSQPTSAEISTKTSSTPPPVQTKEEPQTSVQVITESGAVVTRTVVQTPIVTNTPSTALVGTGSNDSGPNVGAIAGGVAGGLVFLFALIGGIIFLLWRRRRQQQQSNNGDSGSNGGGSTGITRNTSTMSRNGLLGSPADVEFQYPPRIATNFSTQNSRYGDHESISPISNRRNSQPLMIDSRLNPNAVLTFAGANASRDSLASMDDSRDYGRQLNVRNPDH